ncbi:MAG: phosphoglucosamine mutase [Actinobacteria bacterium]|nr:phosphoglucosamine mutase [Actinomycetota bacterium]
MGQLFGTDGIRGVANTELTPELVVGLGRALVRTLREEGMDRPVVLVGRDPRASGEMLEAALVAGVTSAGGDVIGVGVMPTPGVAYLTAGTAGTGSADAGAMISASHNPVEDNGIKFFGPDGGKLTDAEEERIEELLQLVSDDRPVGAHIGRFRRDHELLVRYVEHLAGAADGSLSDLHVVVDCANGAASHVAPFVLRRLGAQVDVINARPDGTNINAGCGSIRPEVVAEAVVSAGADVGLSHDGDADRLIAADHTGAIVDGDVMLAILAADQQQRTGLDTVVTTVMTNLGFTRAMNELGIEVIQTAVGDRYVREAMLAGGHPLGGEQSGHLILTDYATTGDGVLTAVRLLTVLVRSGRSLHELATVMQRLPQVLCNVADVDRNRLADSTAVWQAVESETESLGDGGRVLVRASGTEQLVRVMVEAETEERASEVADRLAKVVARELSLD